MDERTPVGCEGPPLEAYSRVTNPERFASLHDVAAELLDRLEREFDVELTEGYGLDPELEEGLWKLLQLLHREKTSLRDCRFQAPSLGWRLHNG